MAATPAGLLDLSTNLQPVLDQWKLPALAAAVIKDGALAAASAVGVRRIHHPERVTLEDKFHIGSCTKSFTAALAAMLVEEGKISWETTIGEVLRAVPDLHADYKPVTLRQLLSHRGGFASNPEPTAWEKIFKYRAVTAREERMFALREFLRVPPEFPPGTKYNYSNAGYTVAGAMLETLAGRPWEELALERICRPLEMRSAGFGAPASPGQTDQPWGHVAERNRWLPFLSTGKLQAIEPGPEADNPRAIGPAGTLHCSILDLARYANWHLQGARGQGVLLKPASFKELHTPIPGQEYALGWLVVQRPWAGGDALTHAGSNTMFFTVIWIAPKKNFAVVIATNAGQPGAAKACDEVAGKMIQQFLISQ